MGSGGGGAGGATGSGGIVLSAGQGGTSGGGGSVGGGGVSDPNAPVITERDGCIPKAGPTIKDIPGARLVHEARGIDNIDALGLFNGALYFAETNQGISRLSPPSAQPGTGTLVSKYSAIVWSLLVSGNQLFTVETNSRELWRSSLATLPATPELVEKDSDVDEQSMVADDTSLYFSTSKGGIYSLPLTSAPGTAPTQLVPTVHSSHMVLADGSLYYVDAQSVYRVAVGGGVPEGVAGAGDLRSLTVSDGVVYLAADDSILKWVPSRNLSYTQLATGTPVSPESQYNKKPYGLQETADRIYYREGGGSLAWVKKDGSDCRIVVALDESGLGTQTLALTDTHYYLVVDDSKLYEIPR